LISSIASTCFMDTHTHLNVIAHCSSVLIKTMKVVYNAATQCKTNMWRLSKIGLKMLEVILKICFNCKGKIKIPLRNAVQNEKQKGKIKNTPKLLCFWVLSYIVELGNCEVWIRADGELRSVSQLQWQQLRVCMLWPAQTHLTTKQTSTAGQLWSLDPGRWWTQVRKPASGAAASCLHA